MKKVVVSVGQFIYRKGFDCLLEAWARCSTQDAILIIIGDTPTEEYIKLTKRLKLNNVRFMGFMPKSKLKEYYRASDFFVLPTREDIWGLVINEAMAAGLPVITTDRCVAGLELVDDGVNGFIVESDNIAMLAEKIDALLANEELVSKMSKANLDRISQQTIEKMVFDHMSAFKKHSRSSANGFSLKNK